MATLQHKKVWYAPNQKEAYGQREIDAVMDCLQAGWLAGFGPRSVEFERRVSELFAKKHGLFVNSGSSAILLGLNALNLAPGDEIVTPACTFSTTIVPSLSGFFWGGLCAPTIKANPEVTSFSRLLQGAIGPDVDHRFGIKRVCFFRGLNECLWGAF